ncbi:hypothetical protein CTAYLR_001446 [Chrysophaeum taylorii]|uniref:CFA20 domain-containing protein n=1 Tax=Chrysophaeum taylorii TaxID=2483200 RepID=A0AAD7U8U6_9STRA|nr:hypothetical protein CTAYLR_001446 [Chrysophaeum taylorii]
MEDERPREESKQAVRESEEDVEVAGAKVSVAYSVLAWAIVVAFGATTLTMAILFPVKKHKFTRFECLSHDELQTLEVAAIEDVLPYAIDYGCGLAKEQCDGARLLRGEDLIDGCDTLFCVELAVAAIGSPVDLAAQTGKLWSVEGAVKNYCAAHPSASWCAELDNVTASCLASAACEAAEAFWAAPQQFCASSAETHASKCATAEQMLERLDVAVDEWCASGDVEKVACDVVNASLHDRGYYRTYCNSGKYRRDLCDEVITLFNETVCRRDSTSRELCDVGAELLNRWANASAALPIVDVALQAVEIYCANGICDDANGLTDWERLQRGSLALHVDLIETSLPSLCDAWPITEEICYNATHKLLTFCADHTLACEWLGQLIHLNLSRAEDLVVSTWRDAISLCEAADLATTSALGETLSSSEEEEEEEKKGNPVVPFTSASLGDVVAAACDLVAAVDQIALQCPEMLPLIYDAESSSSSSTLVDTNDTVYTLSYSNRRSLVRVEGRRLEAPLLLKNGWQFVRIDFRKALAIFGAEYFASLEVSIRGNCQIARLYLADKDFSDLELPRNLQLLQ